MRLPSLLLLLATLSLSAAEGTLVVPLAGSFPLRSGGLGLFGGQEETLHEVTFRLSRALAEPEPRIVLDCSSGFAAGPATAEELATIVRTKKGDKRVVMLIDGIDDAALILAAVCDEVVTADAGLLLVDGLAISTDYYADALARVGVRFHAVTSGPAKAAPEPLTRSGPSAAAKAEFTALLEGLDQAVLALSTRGTLDAAALGRARARSPQTPAIARESGLVDDVVEVGAWLRDLPEPVRWLEVEDSELDLESLSGMMTAWSRLLQGGSGRPWPEKAVAVVELVGEIVDEADSEAGTSIGTDLADLIDEVGDDDRIVAVVLRIDSPGGAPGCSDRIHHAIRRCRTAKPVIALCEGVAASGGYYIACAADRILVHRTTITGSIGVFAVMPDLGGTRDLLGVHRHTVATGPRATLFDADAMTPDKEAALRQIIEDVDQRFQGLVAETRHLDPAKVRELAGGRVYSGDQAVAQGLADGLGDLQSAVVAAREQAGEDQPLPLVRLPEPEGLAGMLRRGLSLSQVVIPSSWRRLAAQADAGRPFLRCWFPPLRLR